MKNAGRRRASINYARERTKPNPPALAPTRPTVSSSKAAAMQFASKGARSDMELVFDRFCALDKSAELDAITGKGLAQLFNEVGVAASSLECMALLWKLGATQQGCIMRPEWLISMYAHGIESMMQLRQKLGEWVKQVRESDDYFLLMYNYLYDYIRGEDDRCMTLATAIQGWDVFFWRNARYTEWKAWALVNIKGPVTRDLWRQLGIFFTENSATGKHSSDQVTALPWPSTITDFVDRNGEPAS
ncbi:hypothetical protein LSCM1_02457 [Leishmania martiniquensis]|uniref:Defective in cullin neddylation protein n=1 Tax=Leishmania martiniquensis TaxID=1580590 RepID=A0A836FSL6_9TRYP|nr:hypothetical protein LSCM1_02457 [Leishmania martiniquensis]